MAIKYLDVAMATPSISFLLYVYIYFFSNELQRYRVIETNELIFIHER